MANDTLMALLMKRAHDNSSEPSTEDTSYTKYSTPKKTPEERLAEAQAIAAQHPRSAEAQKGVKVTNSPILTKINSYMPGGWGQSYGRSFSVPELNQIHMSPDDPNYANTYAHELGHIDQYKQGGMFDVGHSGTEQAILRDLLQMQDVKESIVPRPYEPVDPYVAEVLQRTGNTRRRIK